MGTSKPGRFIVLDVHDWDLIPGLVPGVLVFRPSARTIARQLWVTAVCAVLMIVLVMVFGLPPGTRQVRQQAKVVNTHELRVQSQRRQVEQLQRSAAGVGGDVVGPMVQGAQRNLAVMEQELDRQRAKLDAMRPTLGTTGDLMCWIGMGVLALIGVGLPLSGRFERVMLLASGDSLRIITRMSLIRPRVLPLDGFRVLAIHVMRLVKHQGSGRSSEDHGWLWQVMLLADPGNERAMSIELRIDREAMLPPRVEDLTARTRQVVRFFEQATGLPPKPPLSTDVAQVSPTMFGRRIRLKSVAHGPVVDRRYKPLDPQP